MGGATAFTVLASDDVDEVTDGPGGAESDEDDGTDLFEKLRSDRG